MTYPDLLEAMRMVPYNGVCVPGRVPLSACASGSNCQIFAYALLAYHGIHVPPWRSSDLWADTSMSSRVTNLLPLDLLLWHRTVEPWGAHVGVYLGEGRAAHLSKKLGVPAVWPLERFLEEPDYRTFIGAKRFRAAPALFATHAQ